MRLEKIKDILKQKNSNLSPERIEDFYNELLLSSPYARKLSEEEFVCCIELLERERQNPKKVQVYITQTEETRLGRHKGPPLLIFSVLAPDWAGLLDSCLAIIHEEGLNLSYCYCFLIEYKGEDWGVFLMELPVPGLEFLEKFKARRSILEEKITRAATKDEAKKILQKGEARKLDEYSKVVELLRKNAESPQELEGLIGEKGEAIKFFVGRTEAYLQERKPEDLALEILNNYRFVQRIRQKQGDIEVAVKNIQTTKGENNTGLTIAGLERELSLGDILSVIEELMPGYLRKYDKGFITTDGINVFRIEIVKKDNTPLNESLQQELVVQIKSLKEKRKKQEIPPGVELIWRKIVPLLQEEEKTLHLPQVYFHPHSANLTKIILVTSGEDRGKGIACVREINKIKGFITACPDLPTQLQTAGQEQEITILDLWIDKERLKPTLRVDEEFLPKIEEALRKVEKVGPRFRIFDRTTRLLRQMRWEKIIPALEGFPSDLAKEIFYHLGDKFLVSPEISEGEIIEIIKQAINVYEEFRKTNTTQVYIDNLEEQTFSFVFTALAASEGKEELVFEVLQDYQVKTFCQVDWEDGIIFIFRLSQNDRALTETEIDSLKMKATGWGLNIKN
ncbi:MAG: hypothetical protein AB1393_00560 [Candidatus Edwardsbacteria bacterium]